MTGAEAGAVTGAGSGQSLAAAADEAAPGESPGGAGNDSGPAPESTGPALAGLRADALPITSLRLVTSSSWSSASLENLPGMTLASMACAVTCTSCSAPDSSMTWNQQAVTL